MSWAVGRTVSLTVVIDRVPTKVFQRRYVVPLLPNVENWVRARAGTGGGTFNKSLSAFLVAVSENRLQVRQRATSCKIRGQDCASVLLVCVCDTLTLASDSHVPLLNVLSIEQDCDVVGSSSCWPAPSAVFPNPLPRALSWPVLEPTIATDLLDMIGLQASTRGDSIALPVSPNSILLLNATDPYMLQSKGLTMLTAGGVTAAVLAIVMVWQLVFNGWPWSDRAQQLTMAEVK